MSEQRVTKWIEALDCKEYPITFSHIILLFPSQPNIKFLHLPTFRTCLVIVSRFFEHVSASCEEPVVGLWWKHSRFYTLSKYENSCQEGPHSPNTEFSWQILWGNSGWAPNNAQPVLMDVWEGNGLHSHLGFSVLGPDELKTSQKALDE